MLFYIQNPEQGTVKNEDFNHLRSHRLQLKDKFWATNLQGSLYECQISKLDKKSSEANFDILSLKISPIQLQKILVQAIPDKLYLDKLVEVATFAGFQEIILFASDFSPSYNPNLLRLKKISRSASLLSEQLFEPQIKILDKNTSDFQTYLTQAAIILEQFGEIADSQIKSTNIENIIVGPEGGWSPKELDWFRELDLKLVSLDSAKVYPAWLAGSVWKFYF